jgi:hypothetical protein
MVNPVPPEGKALPPPPELAATRALDRLSSFRITYVAVLAFVFLYVFSVKGLERVFDHHFRAAVAQALRVQPSDDFVAQLQSRVDAAVRRSWWTRVGGVSVTVFVLGADGRTPLYVDSPTLPPLIGSDPAGAAHEAARLLPAIADVSVSVPHNSLIANLVLVGYAAALVTFLFGFNRRLARREAELLHGALAARHVTAERAEQIERELAQVRTHLSKVEPVEEMQQEEIRRLQAERAALQQKLGGLAAREAELRAQAGKALELDEERQALEALLEEALRDVTQRDEEIRSLQSSLKRAARNAPAAPRARESELVGRRWRTLYKNLEIDDRAIDDLVALDDEALKLRAEEAVKRLCDEPESAAVRRKVGGLPPGLSIFELGFAGKGRIYYTKGEVRRFRVLLIGTKASQKTDLEYLSRLT